MFAEDVKKRDSLQSWNSMENTDIRLSVSEAAKFFGVSTRTIRRAIVEKAVDYILVQNRYKIDLASLLDWASNTTTVRHKLEKDGFGQYVEKWKIPPGRQ